MMAHRPLLRAFEEEAAREAAKLTGASAAAAGGPEEGELEEEEEGALPEEGECAKLCECVWCLLLLVGCRRVHAWWPGCAALRCCVPCPTCEAVVRSHMTIPAAHQPPAPCPAPQPG
jgi:hypothetical protein